MGLQVKGVGDPSARIWLVGEAPGFDEELAGTPFVGASGRELDKMLREAGIDRDACYVTNVCQWRPPGNDMSKWLERKASKKEPGGYKYVVDPRVAEGRAELLELLQLHRPQLVIGFGNTALWALTGHWGIGNWRGSELCVDEDCHVRFVPTYHPAAVLRNWSSRVEVMHDLRFRCKRRLEHGFVTPEYDFQTFPDFYQTMYWIDGLEGDVSMDIETSEGKTICLGLARSPYSAICIPFWGPGGRYWSVQDQDTILSLLDIKINSGQIQLIGQNWNYDRQYMDEDFGMPWRPSFDTYIAQSVLFPGTERGLGYLSSMYCDHHVYWKEDGKDWAKGIKDFDKEFRYNCRDACTAYEIAQRQSEKLMQAGLWTQFDNRMRYGDYVYRMMRRGVYRCPVRTNRMIEEVQESIHERELAVAELAGHEVNFASPKQVSQLLFKEAGFKPVGKATPGGAASTKDEALRALVEKYPDAARFCTPILEARSLATIKSNFLEAEIDPDGRLRCSWMATGTETFRLTSSKNAFHRGGPLQNITDGKHTHSGRRLPNLRSTIVPPPGSVYWNCDLERADLQVVAWEADDESMKRMLRERVDVHLANAIDLFDIKGVPLDECVESHPNYNEHKSKHEQPRHFAKTFCHLTNYLGGERTCAIKTHTTVHKSGMLQKRWFEIHPGIKRWHQRTIAGLMGTRTVRNKFGFRRIYFDRIESCASEAIAWIPQSTVSIVISLMQMAIEDACAEFADRFGIELQVHDSLSGYYHSSIESVVLPRMYQASRNVIVPYDDPLWIPLELSTSTDSWGLVEKRAWPIGLQTS